MASVDVAVARSSTAAPGAGRRSAQVGDGAAADVMAEIFDRQDKREKFIPVTRQALMERLTRQHAWPGQQAGEARRFFRYLDYWRQQTYGARLLELEQTYEPFSPDSDLLITRRFSAAEREAMQKRLVTQVSELLEQANFIRVNPDRVELILTKDSHYGLDLHVDLSAFDELMIYYRGATKLRKPPQPAHLVLEERGVRAAGVPATVHRLQAEAGRGAHPRRDEAGGLRPRES